MSDFYLSDFPDELLINILIFLFPDKNCDINNFKHYFLVNYRWYNLLHSFNYRHKILNKYKLFINNKNKNNYKLLNSISNYNNIIETICYNYIYLKFDPKLIDIIGYINLINIPVCKFRKSKCIDNLCSSKCYMNNHNLGKYINNTIMRGIDNKNRAYLLFIYKDLETDKIYYEFIYHKYVKDDYIVTYSGFINNTFIGMVSDYTIFYNYEYHRELNIYSYNYIHKLLKNDLCRIPEYCKYNDKFTDTGKKGNITLYYDLNNKGL